MQKVTYVMLEIQRFEPVLVKYLSEKILGDEWVWELRQFDEHHANQEWRYVCVERRRIQPGVFAVWEGEEAPPCRVRGQITG